MELNVRPVPIPDPISEFYWESAKQGRLAVQGFEGLDLLQHPPSPVPEIPGGGPEGAVPIAVEVSGAGRCLVHGSPTTVPSGFVDAIPMMIGLTELDDAPGVRILTNIVEAQADELWIGMPMEVVFERRGDMALPQFRPARRLCMTAEGGRRRRRVLLGTPGEGRRRAGTRGRGGPGSDRGRRSAGERCRRHIRVRR